MKTLIATLVLLALMLGGICVNYFYVNRVADELLAMAENLPEAGEETAGESVRELREYWETRSAYIGLSVGYTVTDRVSEQTVTLDACASTGDVFGYRIAQKLLIDAVGDMRRLESFSLENLLYLRVRVGA